MTQLMYLVKSFQFLQPQKNQKDLIDNFGNIHVVFYKDNFYKKPQKP